MVLLDQVFHTNLHAIEVDVVALGFVFANDCWWDGAASLGSRQYHLFNGRLGEAPLLTALCPCCAIVEEDVGYGIRDGTVDLASGLVGRMSV